MRTVLTLCLFAGWTLTAPLSGQDAPAIDRGLPKANLNNAASDASRSNVRWSLFNRGFAGDDFFLGQDGERWVIDKIRVWAVPGTQSEDPPNLGDVYQDVRLYFGDDGGALTPVLSGRLKRGGNQTNERRIRITDAAAEGVLPYDDFGLMLRIWQIDFSGLDLAVEGGRKYRFGVWGLGRPVVGKENKIYPWFTHGSNAALSEARQDGADGRLLTFDSSGSSDGEFDSNGNAWNKSSDLNVQVFARRVE